MAAAIIVSSLALATFGFAPGTALANTGAGAVYVLTNQTGPNGGNSVQVYRRAENGSLSFSGSFATQGDGTGGGLGDQGALLLRGDRLFAVDAGSNEITSFAVSESGLHLTRIKTIGSGGTTPISLTASDDLLYVLNAGGTGNIAGFTGAQSGKLVPLASSTKPLSASSGTGAAQISFTNGGSLLVVTEKATNLIDTYTVGTTGLPTGPTTHASNGATPFGFASAGRKIFVSEAFGGAAGQSAVSSYRIASNGTPTTISASVHTGQSAACWVVLADQAHFAYASNTGSANITGYRVRDDGSISLLGPSGITATTDAGPIDMAVSGGSGYLFSLNSGSNTIGAFRVHDNGSLTPVSGASGLPAGAVGLAAR